MKILGLLTLSLAFALVSCTKNKGNEDAKATKDSESISVKLEAKSESNVSGQVHFIAEKDGGVRVKADISGLEPNTSHGFHIHEKPDCSAADGTSAGGHFNPTEVKHGDPAGEEHHVGDLGNISSDGEGNAIIDKVFAHLSLKPADKAYIMNRSVVVHGGEDDLESQPSGAAGPRIACGTITL